MKLANRAQEYLQDKASEMGVLFTEWTLDLLRYYGEKEGRELKSPVEQLFFIEWYWRCFIANERDDLNFLLIPQFQNESTGKYRIDFKLDFIGYLLEYQPDRFSENAIISTIEPKIGIEIDGHIWHEKTKEQVQYHKERERFLISKKWIIYRFTGSEVYKNPEKCLDEVYEKTDPIVFEWHKELKKFDEKEK